MEVKMLRALILPAIGVMFFFLGRASKTYKVEIVEEKPEQKKQTKQKKPSEATATH